MTGAARRLYRAALRCLPRWLRERHADAMEALFAHEVERARARGRLAVAAVAASSTSSAGASTSASAPTPPAPTRTPWTA